MRRKRWNPQYGDPHRAIRARLKPVVDGGLAKCTRCGVLIKPGEPWDLDHTDDRKGYAGAAHQHCNRSAGAKKRNKSRRQSRRW